MIILNKIQYFFMKYSSLLINNCLRHGGQVNNVEVNNVEDLKSNEKCLGMNQN